MLERRQAARGGREESSIAPESGENASRTSGQTPEYTYLTVPETAELRSCLGVVLAGLTARAGVGVGRLEEAVRTLEESHAGGNTGFRFALREGEIHVQVGQVPGEISEDGEGAGWRTLVELAS